MKIKVLDKGFVELVDHMGDETRIVNAARVSFGKRIDLMEKKDIKLLKYLYDHRHTTPFEMVEFAFNIKCPIFVVRQWHRHRTWSYNELSRRYTSDNVEFHVPEILRMQDEKNKQSSHGEVDDNSLLIDYIEDKNNRCLEAYEYLLEEGVTREQARMVLPHALYTEFFAKTDLHNLLHFLRLRCDEHAQWEIRQYANTIVELIKPIVPNVMKIAGW